MNETRKMDVRQVKPDAVFSKGKAVSLSDAFIKHCDNMITRI